MKDDLDKFVDGAVAKVDDLIQRFQSGKTDDYVGHLSALRDNLSHIQGTLRQEGRI